MLVGFQKQMRVREYNVNEKQSWAKNRGWH